MGEPGPIDDGGAPLFTNRKKLSVNTLKKLSPQQLSRYRAYEQPSKVVVDAQQQAMKRLLDLKKRKELVLATTIRDDQQERGKHERLIGQLKAAEARNRLRIMRLRYQANRAQEIGHLIACQPVALKAVRLQALLPPYPDIKDKTDTLDKLDRMRVESLVEDISGLLTSRNY